MAVIIIPSNDFSQSLNSDTHEQAFAIIRLLEKLKNFNVKILLKISFCDYNTIKELHKLRILKEYLLTGIQIPYLIEERIVECKKHLEVNGSQALGQFSKLFISIIHNDLQIPLILTNTPVSISKQKCKTCQHNSKFCKEEFHLKFPPLDNSTVDNILDTIRQHNLDNQLIYNKDFDKRSILNLVEFLIQLVKFQGNPDILKNLEICDSFLNDLNKSNEDKLSIALSVTRMMAHPPSRKKQKNHQYSIDWHRDFMKFIETEKHRYEMYRLDVLDSLSKKGLRKSGAKRVLVAKVRNKTLLVSYTTTHFFCKSKAKKRIEEHEKNF